jgi:hypothetical protein
LRDSCSTTLVLPDILMLKRMLYNTNSLWEMIWWDLCIPVFEHMFGRMSYKVHICLDRWVLSGFITKKKTIIFISGQNCRKNYGKKSWQQNACKFLPVHTNAGNWVVIENKWRLIIPRREKFENDRRIIYLI